MLTSLQRSVLVGSTRVGSHSFSTQWGWISVLTILAFQFGCGSNRPETVPVNGTVTLNNSPAWPVEGELYFLPVDPADGYVRRPGSASFGKDGIFVAKTWVEGDGLTPGKYKVMVTCWKNPPSITGPAAVSYVDAKFQSGASSDLTLDVAPDAGSIQVDWDVTGPSL